MQTHPERESLLRQAASLLATGDEQGAIALYDRLLATRPDDAESLCMRGVALRMLANRVLEAAWHDYERAIEADPDFPKPHFQLIRLADSLGRLDQVVRAYKQRILANRVEPKNYAYLGFALLTAGDTDSALRVVETGLAVGPTDPYLHYTRGEILRARGDIAEAVAAWERALLHDASLVDALYALGEVHEDAGRTAQARAVWQQLAARLEELGAPDAQIADVKRRMDGDPKDAKNRFAAGSGGLEPFS